MDPDYLKNMAGSPYVNEGVIDRLKSQAAKVIRSGAAMFGHIPQNRNSNPPQTPNTSSTSINIIGEIVEQVMKIIIDAVSSDVRSKKWMTIPKLPTTWDQPPITKWEDPKDNIKEESESDESDRDSNGTESKGEFLYNFHSRQNKSPTASTIIVNPTNKSLSTLKLSDGKTVSLVVIWGVENKHENNIYVKHKTIDDNGSSDHSTLNEGYEDEVDTTGMAATHIFKFWDQQANPRTPHNNFNVELFFDQAHPSKRGLLNKLDTNIKSNIDKLTPTFQRACYATTSRKHMEFSPKGLNIRMTTDGTVLNIKRDGNHEIVPLASIELYLQDDSPTRRKLWLDALTRIKWFDHHGYEIPKSAETPIKLVKIDGIPIAPLSAAAEDAVTALTQVSPWNKDIPLIKKYVGISYQKLGDTATSEEIANDALLNMKSAMKGTHKPEKTQDVAPYSSPLKPSGIPSKENPVSIEPSTSGGNSSPTSPISNVGKADVVQKIKSKNNSDLGSVKFDDKGNVEWIKPDGTIRKFTAKQINNMASPRLKKVLKKNGYPFEKHGISNMNEFINPFQVGNLL